ncbi:acyl-CoA thioesterase [Paenalkalicoccus suaedae]|uniref:Acyl-CoA thioesterase n=2 Tax=Paenalkalicoccus suaedae TaxID=2592382 RepID=A0A859FEI1_9BACI|nr:thioesterase family protein [Paenalkalicoccus suaedae]QKS71331.1 acyl-CoA thioesterase [Paenalkalicoccus suaedae]
MIVETTADVRYAETDQMGVVYHANYLVWCEIGRTALLDALGYRYADLEKEEILSPVTSLEMNYKHPAKYGETVTIKTRVEAYTGVRVTYSYEIVNEKGDSCLEGTSTHALVKKGSFKPVSMKRVNLEMHEAYLRAIGK